MPTASSTDTAKLGGALAGRTPNIDLAAAARNPQLRIAVLVGLGYYAGARLGFLLTLEDAAISILWPPNAILLASLLLTPLRSWAVVFGAAFVAHVAVQLAGGVPPGMVLCWFVSNSTEALIGAVAFRRLHSGEARLDTLRETFILLLCIGFLAPFLSSFLDAAFVALNGWGTADYWTNWRTRFVSNVLTEITVVPLIVTSARSLHRLRQIPRARLIEAAAIFALLVATSWAVFVQIRPGPEWFPTAVYAPFPLLVAAAVRLGPWGASVAFMAWALAAIWGAVLGQGPFVTGSASHDAQAIQIFLIVAWVPIMSVATLTEDRTRAEQAARRSEEQLAIALEAAQLGRWEWDLTQQRLEWSDITRRMYGVPLDAPITPETFGKILHPDDGPLLEATIQDALAGRPIEAEFRVILPDGQVRWIMSRGKTLFGEDGRPARMLGIKVDITARRQTEMQLKEQQRELAHIDRLSMVDELSVAIAHELNQPLAAIQTNIGAARRFLSHEPPDYSQVREIIDAIAEDNRRAAAVIHKVGALLRREELPFAPLLLNEIVEDVIEITRADMIARAVSISTRLDQNMDPISGDRVQLQQVLLNLVLNACDAMNCVPETARRLTIVSEQNGDGRARVTVRDNGPGVAGDQLERVFEPFVTSKPQGLGLGLAVCRTIVTAHDGRLWAENNADGGAAFCFELPCVG